MDGGRLLRFPKASGPAIPAFLDDHAHVADGLLDLAEATGEAALGARPRGGSADAIARAVPRPGRAASSRRADRPRDAARAGQGRASTRRSRRATRRPRACSSASRRARGSRATARPPTPRSAACRAARRPRARAARWRSSARSPIAPPPRRRGAAPAAPDAVVRRGPARGRGLPRAGEATPGHRRARAAPRAPSTPAGTSNPAGRARATSSRRLARPRRARARRRSRAIAFPAAARRGPRAGPADPVLDGHVRRPRRPSSCPPRRPRARADRAPRWRFQPCDATSCRPPARGCASTSRCASRADDAPPRHPTLFR